MDDFFKNIERLANLKGIVILLLILIVSFFVYRNLDFITEITFKVDKSKQTAQSDSSKQNANNQTAKPVSAGGYAEFEILDLSLSPIDFRLPKYFYFEVHNKSNAGAYNVTVTIDLGRANLTDIEVRSASVVQVFRSDSVSNLVKVNLSFIGKEESAYFYLLLTNPSYKRISVSSSNMITDLVRKYDGPQINSVSSGFISDEFMTFIRILAGIVLIVFTIYSLYVIISFLNRLFKLE
jgi:hypothetical protein